MVLLYVLHLEHESMADLMIISGNGRETIQFIKVIDYG
jgi:hypothetical protein